jgi:hypothetical protein
VLTKKVNIYYIYALFLWARKEDLIITKVALSNLTYNVY